MGIAFEIAVVALEHSDGIVVTLKDIRMADRLLP
jgi:hypothetical protein